MKGIFLGILSQPIRLQLQILGTKRGLSSFSPSLLSLHACQRFPLRRRCPCLIRDIPKRDGLSVRLSPRPVSCLPVLRPRASDRARKSNKYGMFMFLALFIALCSIHSRKQPAETACFPGPARARALPFYLLQCCRAAVNVNPESGNETLTWPA